MNLMTDEQFDRFFEPYAANVAGFYEAAYWQLADELIRELVRRHLSPQPGDRMLDAGGGTGRWARWAATEFGITVTVADKSRHMLAQAAAEADGSQVELLECDLQDAPQLPDRAFDSILSTYGVLSFLDDPAAAFATLFRVLKPGGRALLMSHSLSNALASKVNRDGADAAVLRELRETKLVRWAPHVPPLRVFSAQDLRDLATGAGFRAEAVFGVTSVVSPGPEDFGYPYQELSKVSQALTDPGYFRTVLDLELAATEQPEWAERGTNLMIKVWRPDGTV
jgi:ubiquinone/menaquinone biosynthesis C-methylase UbiE